MIAILDYETGQADALRRAFEDLGAAVDVVNSVDRIERASRIVLPDGGPFASIIRSLRDRGYVGPLFDAARHGVPFLGVGHGLHLLFDVSYESGQHTGLGLIKGKVARMDPGGHPVSQTVRPPHRRTSPVYWNGECPLLAGLRSGTAFYFDHEYHAEPLDAATVVATCNYGIDFAAVIRQDYLSGVQFLPERSGEAGMQVLANFVRS